MASGSGTNSKRAHLLHVGYMVPLNELIERNASLENELGNLNLRQSIYSALLFYRDTNQDSLTAWYDQRKKSSRPGYLRAYYMNKKGDAVVEMDVDGKQFYLIASTSTSKPPIQIKQEIAKGLYGERKPFAERIQVPCFPYKCDTEVGFTECEAFKEFKKQNTPTV